MMQFIPLTVYAVPFVAYTLRQVLETPSQRSNRHDSAVLSCPNCAISPSATGGNGFGQDGASGNAARTSDYVFRTSCPPDARRKANGGFLLNQESETMTTTLVARAATTTSKSDTIPTCNLTALIAAYNAAGLAQSYLEKGNFTAARRKLVLALRDIELLTKSEGGAA